MHVVDKWDTMQCELDNDMMAKFLSHEAGFWLRRLLDQALSSN